MTVEVMGGPASHVELGLLWNGEQHGRGHGRGHEHGRGRGRATSSRAACDSRWMGAVQCSGNGLGRQCYVALGHAMRWTDGGEE